MLPPKLAAVLTSLFEIYVLTVKLFSCRVDGLEAIVVTDRDGVPVIKGIEMIMELTELEQTRINIFKENCLKFHVFTILAIFLRKPGCNSKSV